MGLDIFSSGIDLIKTGVNKIFPDKEASEQRKAENAKAQITVNTEEAKRSFSWRSALGWVCVLTLTYSLLANWLGLPKLPTEDTVMIFKLLIGMLGILQ